MNKNMQAQKLIKAIPELLSRLVIGFVFIEAGWGKFHNLAKVTSYFESLGIPFAQIQAPFVAGIELVAGILILIGLMTRLASLPLMVIMLVALRTAKWEDVTDFSSLLGISDFLYFVILTWLAAHGAKYLAIDAMICKSCRGGTCQND